MMILKGKWQLADEFLLSQSPEGAHAYLNLLRDKVFLRNQEALYEGLILASLWPLTLRPLPFLPAEVKPTQY